jgi:hypothetical protein
MGNKIKIKGLLREKRLNMEELNPVSSENTLKNQKTMEKIAAPKWLTSRRCEIG